MYRDINACSRGTGYSIPLAGLVMVDANIILADTKRDILDESNGHTLALRLQYLI